MACLWCDEPTGEITWNNLLLGKNRHIFCLSCEKQLKKTNPKNRCKSCCAITEGRICTDCKQWDRIYQSEKPLVKNYSVFQYDGLLKEIISQWKYRGDYVLIKGIIQTFVKQFNEQFSTEDKIDIIAIPLSEERLRERGFNQAYQLASFLTNKVCDYLMRIDKEKQAKKSRYERLNRMNPFHCKQKIKYPVILVDDIYTTGATLYAAAETLRKNGCPKVYSFTLARS